MSKGKLFILSGPSGSGKDAVRSGVFKKLPQLKFSISCTTRNPRNILSEDEKYRFVSRDEFENMIRNDQLLEHAEFCGNFYGTPRPPIEEWINAGFNVMVEIDVVGQKQIAEKMPEAVSIFIMPPSLAILRKRLEKRQTEAVDVLEKRLGEAVREIKCAERYDYIVINDALEEAVDDVCAIISGEIPVDENKNNIIYEVLNNA